jgi:hypothetical protein
MSDQEQDDKQDPKEVQAFLQRLSRDKHAFGAHLGMRVDRDFTALEEHERAWAKAKARSNSPPKDDTKNV